MQEFFGPAGKWYPSKGYNAYATGSVTHFDRARLLEDYGNSVYTHEMTHNSDGAIYFEGYGRREGLGRNSMLGDSCIFAKPRWTNHYAQYSLPRWTRILRHVCIPIISRNVFKMKQTYKHYVHGMFWHDLHLDYPRRYFYAEAERWCLTYSGSGRWRITILQISMVRKTMLVTDAKLYCWEIKQLKTFDSLIENDVINSSGE